MIKFLSATPGSGKSLLATEMVYQISKSNVSNIKYNYFYAKAFFEKVEQLKLHEYFVSIIIEVGQGLEKTSELIFLEPDYFDFLKTEYNINVVMDGYTDDIIQNYPPFYFERISILNKIIEKINIEQKTKFINFKPVRTIYTNIANLKLSQARPLPSDMDWRNTPQGSYFFIDEAQLIPIFSEEAKQIDPIVKKLTIHRHKGYDFLFITQDPSFVHKYIRKLASHHTHLVNIFGWEQSMKLEWSTVQEVPNAARSLIRAENITRWLFPKHVYKLYQSTTIDTRVKRYPRKMIICIIAALLLFATAFFTMDFDSAFFRLITGRPIPTEVSKNESTKPNNAAQSSGSAAQPVPVSGIANNSQAEPSLHASGAVPSDSSHSNDELNATTNGSKSSDQPIYDPENPFSFKPVSNPAVVNHRVF
jgi:zona occludens toxin